MGRTALFGLLAGEVSGGESMWLSPPTESSPSFLPLNFRTPERGTPLRSTCLACSSIVIKTAAIIFTLLTR